MPVATGRTTANKTITLPNGGTVVVPVITQLNVVDPVDRYQETDYTIINTVNDPVTNKPTHRQVHVDQIDETGNIDNSQPYPPGDSALLPVERVDMWPVLDAADRAQESDLTLYNDQANYDPNGPPFFTRHKASHVVRVQNDPDDGNYVDVELIDELDWIDPVDRGQETDLTLNQPQGTYDPNSGMYVITADPSDPDITDTSSGIDPPFRLDPFQNIVGYAEIQPEVSLAFAASAYSSAQSVVDTGIPIANIAPDGGFDDTWLDTNRLWANYATSANWSVSSTAVFHLGPFCPGPNVSISPTSISCGQWQYGGNSLTGGLVFPSPSFASPGASVFVSCTTPSSPPLIIKGQTIPGFTSALTFPFSIIADVLTIEVYDQYLFTPPYNLPNWMRTTIGLASFSGGRDATVGGGSVTIDPTPFPITLPSGGTVNYQAVGVSSGQDLNGPSIQIYCVKA